MTTGKAKIEGLTNAWYGFAVFSALFSVLESGLGILSITWAILGMLVSWVVTFFIGRALIKKSSVTRALLIVLSALFSVGGALAVGKTAWSFVHHWELTLLWAAVYSGVSAYMNGRSFKTLLDPSVKAYFH